METLRQVPQPTIRCYKSVKNGKAVTDLYQEFTPKSAYVSGKNLQSYNFEKSLDNFGGSFSFTVKEDVNTKETLFMDKVSPLDVIVLSESGSETDRSFIGVVTTVSIGGISSNLNKVVTVSGKSIEWLFLYYNINADIKGAIFQNDAANTGFKADLAKRDGTEGLSIKDIVMATYDMFNSQVNGTKLKTVTNFVVGDLIKLWYGDVSKFVVADTAQFKYPISSNLFTGGRISIIDYLQKLLPSPIYEIFGRLDDNGKPTLVFREAPFDEPKSTFKINANVLTDFTLTKSCNEVYTAFLPYIEGSNMDPSYYMNLQAGKSIAKGYDAVQKNEEKISVYGFQLLTCSFAGYNSNPDNPSKQGFSADTIQDLAMKMQQWFSCLDEMYAGDFTIVNYMEKKDKKAQIGDWIGFADGLFYITAEKHSWTYGDNPMINYSVTRGGNYKNGAFKPLENLSRAYREFE